MVSATVVQVMEESIHPTYNRYLELDLCSGKAKSKPLDRRTGGIN